MASVQTINPATEEVLAEYGLQSEREVSEAVTLTDQTFQKWRQGTWRDRVAFVERFEAALLKSREKLGRLMSQEMGKPVSQSFSEIDKSIASCKIIRENFGSWVERGEERLKGSGFSVHLRPLGVILGIMPWNFPLWQVVRFAVPALLNGNTILLKHAPNTWGSAELIGRIFTEAFGDGHYVNLKIDVGLTESILSDPRVGGVSLTGSVRAGKSVAEVAGRYLKKCVLELGGSDAYVILDDADIDRSAEVCAGSRLQNTGQSCVAAKRFIVTAKNAAAFTEAMRARLMQVKFDDPLKAETRLGPLARKDLRDHLHEQVLQSVQGGAKLVLGGKLPKERGYFYEPSILTDVEPGQVAFDDELFGPVASIITAKDEVDAFRLANLSRYGLGGAVFSKDTERARRFAIEEMECGMCFVNDFVKSDAHVPFGGIKESGLGRELGFEGCFEFTNVKTVFVKS